MPQIPDRSNFAPDKESLFTWLSTRKSDIPVSHTSIPGFFSDYKSSEDKNWFWIGIVFEVIGIGLICVGAAKKGTSYLLGAILATIVFFVFDLLFAKLLHRNASKRCWIESKLYLIGQGDPSHSQRLKVAKEEGKAIDWAYKIAIITIGIFKVLAVIALGVVRNPILYVFVAALYGVIVYIHLTHTGWFYFAYDNTEKMFKNQHKNFGNNKEMNLDSIHRFEINQPLHNMPIKGGFAEILEDDPKKGNKDNTEFYRYVLKTRGILIDEDIMLLMNGQQNIQRDLIAYECRIHQMNTVPAPQGLN